MKYFICSLLCLTLSGCGGSDLDLVPVSGVVTLDGQPLENASVTFAPITDASIAPTSTGRTDKDGRFTLSTIQGESGAIVAEHKVIIFVEGEADEGDDASANSKSNTIPDRYNNNSELRKTVPPEGLENAEFRLTSDQ